ncbi:hypothetical protein OBBRIDRAFT_733241 [Obba rivulosa]|uniref:Postreplication repair E3 ubiquitin-protein ligase RAD18 n=1 Tax=Obba rivulosa TaxID=1052685 RepID=A0A8E2ARN2_9APHY|nr:hypothetical protein OBBRIDRAFT_733241 [Obba rivulosa]
MQPNVVSLSESDSVQDPTDFPPSSIAPGLRDLDDSLRCPICRELYTAPVTLSCGHCYCSLCIRNSLSSKAECPICRQNASEVHIRKNPAMESVVKSWASGRDFILGLLKPQEDHRTSPSVDSQGKASNTQPDSPSKKRKRTTDDTLTSAAGERKLTPGISKAQVQCPMCNQTVPERTINQHLDSGCQSYLSEASSSGTRGQQKEQWSKVFGNSGITHRNKDKGKAKEKEKEKDGDPDGLSDVDPLPKVSYNVLKDKLIQEYLTEHGLPTNGGRDACIARHQKWVMLFNANLDRSPANRQSLDQLKRELKKWEEAQQTRKHSVTDVVAYQKEHKSEFERLKEEARRRIPDKTSNSAAASGIIVIDDDE